MKLRPSITDYPKIHTGIKADIQRIEIYRTNRRKWFQFWRPKYQEHMLALTKSGIYEIFPPDHKEHPPIFGVEE